MFNTSFYVGIHRTRGSKSPKTTRSHVGIFVCPAQNEGVFRTMAVGRCHVSHSNKRGISKKSTKWNANTMNNSLPSDGKLVRPASLLILLFLPLLYYGAVTLTLLADEEVQRVLTRIVKEPLIEKLS